MDSETVAGNKFDGDDDYIRRLYIKAEAGNLPVGSSTSTIKCPWCKHAQSFSVTKTQRGDILFLCHRASCGSAGYIRDRGSRGPATTERVFTPRVYDHPTQKLASDGLSFLVDRYDLTPLEVQWAGWLYSPHGDSLVMPVLSPERAHRGTVTKSFDRTAPAKNLTYKEADGVWLGWYIRNGNTTKDEQGRHHAAIVVEDPISALKASRIAPSVAMFGTHLNLDSIKEILTVSNNVILCFDRDATTKAYKYAEQFAVFGNFRTVPLSKDLKNMTEEEFKEWETNLSI